jgi:G:T-mismatch repair DNA endonuclease (very short patch repair protein)
LEDGTTRVHQSRRAGDEDLLEVAVAETLTRKGTVYAIEAEQLPGNPSIAALFRY